MYLLPTELKGTKSFCMIELCRGCSGNSRNNNENKKCLDQRLFGCLQQSSRTKKRILVYEM